MVIEIFFFNSLQKSSALRSEETIILIRGTGKRCVSEEEIGTEKVLKWFGYKGIEKRMISAHKKRNEFLNSLFDEFRQKKVSPISVSESSTDGNRKKKGTLVETLLFLQESEPEFYTDDLIKCVLQALFIAGTETTSMTIRWAMRLLLAHPQAFHKLRAEIDSKVGNERLLNESDFTNLPYLQCVDAEIIPSSTASVASLLIRRLYYWWQ
ncbi:hypothetical protein KY290_022579 [Solanum tuberosum]|uniref:Cytochrome P450 n=1 Tax=Solanum tuberosum TaxID=4113 RepID=A0ABQ7V4T8_SOLTU|nr:hypothetical protein KY284_021479 [Solanum tuberosum]KAH0759086.1 hypothetical protein KY290_022579 [Solanum tuberosum]